MTNFQPPDDALSADSGNQVQYLTRRLGQFQMDLRDLQKYVQEHQQSTDTEVVTLLDAVQEELLVTDEELRVQNEELQRLHLALEEERERYRDLFEAAPDGYIITNAHGMIRQANGAAAELLSVESRFLAGKVFANFIVPDQRPAFRTLISRARAGKRQEGEFRLQSRQSEPTSIAVTVAAGQEEKGEYSLRWLMRDVTQRKIAEEMLRRMEARFERAFRVNPIPQTLTTLKEGRFVSVNDSARKFLGLPLEEIIGRTSDEVAYWEPAGSGEKSAAKKRREFLRLLHEKGEARNIEGRLNNRRGEVRDALSSAVVLGQGRDEEPLVLTMFLDITEKKSMEAARQELLRRLMDAEEEERRRISRELHDQMGQGLNAILLGLQALPKEAAASATCAGFAEQVEPLVTLVSELMRQSHRLAWELRPAMLDDLGLVAALQRYAEEWSQRTGVAVDFHCHRCESRMSPMVETALYRLAQEALANVERHAQACNTSILLERTDGHMQIIIEDDGIGFDADTTEPNRLGLLGMHERIALVNGSLTMESTPGAGTTVFARVPLLAAVMPGSKDEEPNS